MVKRGKGGSRSRRWQGRTSPSSGPTRIPYPIQPVVFNATKMIRIAGGWVRTNLNESNIQRLHVAGHEPCRATSTFRDHSLFTRAPPGCYHTISFLTQANLRSHTPCTLAIHPRQRRPAVLIHQPVSHRRGRSRRQENQLDRDGTVFASSMGKHRF